VLLAFTHDFLSFLLVYIFILSMGFSSASNHPLMALLNNWFARQRAVAITLGFVGENIGGALLTPLIGLMVLNIGWRETAVFSGLLVPMVFILVGGFIRNTPEAMGLARDGDPPQPPPKAAAVEGIARPTPVLPAEDFTTREALKTRAFWHLALALGLRMAAKTALHVHLVPLMVWRGISETDALWLVGLFSVAQVAFRLGGAWFGDRWSLTGVSSLAAVAGAGAVGALLLGPQGSLVTGVAFVLLFALGESGNLSSWSLIGHYFGRSSFATLRGMLSLANSPFSIPAPTIMGMVFDRTLGYGAALAPLAFVYLLVSGLYLMLRKPAHPVRPQAATAAEAGP
jgi:sugar phosphate permease